MRLALAVFSIGVCVGGGSNSSSTGINGRNLEISTGTTSSPTSNRVLNDCTGSYTQICPSAGGVMSISANQSNVGLYDIYELTISANSSLYPNPWEDPTITAQIVSPGGNNYSVGGFYYNVDTYKLRFAPREVGLYQWTLTFQDASGSSQTSGSFTARPSSNKGFLQIDPQNIHRFTTENSNRGFYPLGLNECDSSRWFIGIDDYFNIQSVSMDQYFDTMNAAGNNMYRFGFDNCSFSVADMDGDPFGGINAFGDGKNVYDVSTSMRMDGIANKLHNMDWKFMLTFVGTVGDGLFYPNDLWDPNFKQAVFNYHKYIMDRWGAYVDVFELLNEAGGRPNPDQIWYNYVSTLANFVRSYDPYEHYVSTSWEGYPRPQFEIATAWHAYQANDNVAFDTAWDNPDPDRPVIAGEAGNSYPYCNRDQSHERYRIGVWSSFFHQVGVLWWSDITLNCSVASNMFLGASEREASAVFANYVSQFDPLAIPISTNTAFDSRSYCLASDADLGCYIVHVSSHSTVLPGDSLFINIPESLDGASGYFMDPQSGAVLSNVVVQSGSQALGIPSFTTDIVLRVDR